MSDVYKNGFQKNFQHDCSLEIEKMDSCLGVDLKGFLKGWSSQKRFYMSNGTFREYSNFLDEIVISNFFQTLIETFPAGAVKQRPKCHEEHNGEILEKFSNLKNANHWEKYCLISGFEISTGLSKFRSVCPEGFLN